MVACRTEFRRYGHIEMNPPRTDTDSSREETALIRRLRAGDEAAFEEVVRRYGGRLLAVARRILQSEDDAQDAVQDGFWSAFRALDQFKETARLSTWLHRIVVNAALMKQRSRARRAEGSIEELLPTFLEDGHQPHSAVPWPESLEEMVASRETRERVRASIDRLPAIYRNVLVLRDIEDLDTEETAELLGVRSNVVKIRLHRARHALRALLDPQFPGESR